MYDSICSSLSSGVTGAPVGSSNRKANVWKTGGPAGPSRYARAARNRRASSARPVSSRVSRM